MPCRSVRPIAVIRGVLQGITVIGSGRRRVILQAVCKSGHGMPAGGSCRLAIAVRQSPTTSSGAVSTRLGRLLGLPLASNLTERPPGRRPLSCVPSMNDSLEVEVLYPA
jgi:hypothetical protein